MLADLAHPARKLIAVLDFQNCMIGFFDGEDIYSFRVGRLYTNGDSRNQLLADRRYSSRVCRTIRYLSEDANFGFR